MRRGRHQRPTGGVARWLLPALLLHGAVGLAALALSRATGRFASSSAPSTRSASDAQLIFVDPEWSSDAPLDPLARSVSSDAARVTHGKSEEVVTLARQAKVTHGETAKAPTSSDAARLGDAPPPSDETGTPGVAGVEAAPRAAAPALSLDQLGVGGNNPFWSMSRETPEERANQRLQASLRQGSVDRDRERGLGPGGGAVAAARRLAWASETLVETDAVVNVRVGAAGKVASVELLEASSQDDEWRALAAELLKALRSTPLRLGASNGAFGLKLRIASSMRLPSGADPGLRMGVLGQTLLEGKGPGSASLSLSPTAPLRREEVFDTKGRQLDHPVKFEVGLLELKGDVADVAATARRVVQVSVLSVDAAGAP